MQRRADGSQLRRVKELENECSRLKKMYADLTLEHHALEDVMIKKSFEPGQAHGTWSGNEARIWLEPAPGMPSAPAVAIGTVLSASYS